MKLREVFLWNVERAGPIYVLFAVVLAAFLLLLNANLPSAAKGVIVKRLGPDLYFVGFDPAARLSAAERSPEILVRAAANLRKRTGLKTLTPLSNGPALSAILVSRSGQARFAEGQPLADADLQPEPR